MTVICKVVRCPYLSSSGFCKNALVSITENGLCGHIYDKKGQIKKDWDKKEDIVVYDIKEKIEGKDNE